MMEPIPLMAMLEAAKLGDLAATGQLLSLHRDAIVHFCQRHIPADLRAVVSADDICQDVLLEAFRRLPAFEAHDDDALRRWLLTITRNRLQMIVRAHRARKRDRRRVSNLAGEDDSVVALLEELAIYERTPSQSAVNREVIAAIQQAVDRLPSEFGAAVRLRYVDGLSVADAARRMSRTDGSLMTLCSRAMKMLRAEMSNMISAA